MVSNVQTGLTPPLPPAIDIMASLWWIISVVGLYRLPLAYLGKAYVSYLTTLF